MSSLSCLVGGEPVLGGISVFMFCVLFSFLYFACRNSSGGARPRCVSILPQPRGNFLPLVGLPFFFLLFLFFAVFRFFLSFNASGLLVTHDSNPDTLKDTSNERKTKDNIQYATQIRQAQHTQASNQDTSLKERKNERQTKKREKKSQAGKVNIMGTNTPTVSYTHLTLPTIYSV